MVLILLIMSGLIKMSLRAVTGGEQLPGGTTFFTYHYAERSVGQVMDERQANATVRILCKTSVSCSVTDAHFLQKKN